MKKIAFLITIMLLCVNAFALNSEEISTARKLYDMGVFTKPRTLLQWQYSISTIDCASAILKALSVANSNIEERELFYSNKVFHQNKKIEIISIEIDNLKRENELLFDINDELIKDVENQKKNDFYIFLLLIGAYIFK